MVLKLLRYALKLYRKIDISPLDNSNLSFKITIFLVWGVNTLFFISHDAISSELNCYLSYKYKSSALTLQVQPLALPENDEIKFLAPSVGVISSYNFTLFVRESNRIIRERSPPDNLI